MGSPDPLRHHRPRRSRNLMGDSFMERLSERVASGMGTVGFLVVTHALIWLWLWRNGAAGYITHFLSAAVHGGQFDPPEWIGLNLVFSYVAFFTGSLVIISSKAQARREQARECADAVHREELHAHLVELISQNTALTEQDRRLTEQVHAVLLASYESSKSGG